MPIYIPLSIFFLVSTNKEIVAQDIDVDTKLIITGNSGFVRLEGRNFLFANSLTDATEYVGHNYKFPPSLLQIR